MDEKEQALTEHLRYRLERTQACEASGKSITAFAAEHGFPARAMYDGKTVLVRKGVLPRTQGVQFQRVQTTAARSDSKCVTVKPSDGRSGACSVAHSATLTSHNVRDWLK